MIVFNLIPMIPKSSLGLAKSCKNGTINICNICNISARVLIIVTRIKGWI